MVRTADEASVFPDVVVASIQMAPKVGSKAANLKRSIELIEEAAGHGAVIAVLPELANTGYVFSSRREAFELAEAVPDGESASAWIDVARRCKIHVVAGIAERVEDRLYNAAIVAGPKGYIGTYRKLHLWGDEHLFFESGDLGLPVFHTEIGRLGAVICYDGWFPEVYRLLAMRGADIVCMPTNWVPMPGQAGEHMAMANTLAMANAHSNGLNIICADRIGTERGQPFIGQSLIVGAQGWPIAGPASKDREEILYASINLKETRRARHLNAFNDVLRDRRDDIYDPMLGTGWPLPRH
ncbi:nitrilase family protein [Variovorax sp. Root434]|uniref:nitrilase family protein n=1 Tax=Variovorax sp. Root434 TaxID=1736536 RepID=UPI0039E00913